LLDALGAVDSHFTVYVPRPLARVDWPCNITIRAMRLPQSRPAVAAWELSVAPVNAARDKVDLVHYLYPGGPLVSVGRPTVVNLFDVIEWTLPAYRKPWLERSLERLHLRSAARVVTPSRRVREDIHRVLGVPSEKIAVTPLAGPPIRQRPARTRSYWLFVGGTERRKNLRLVLDAMAQGASCGMGLKVVGPAIPGPRYESPSVLLSSLPPALHGDVEWLGQVEEHVLDRLYSEATALIYPSLSEGFGLPVLEAMARHTPVIASRVPSLDEANGSAALLVDPHDASQLGHSMRRVMSDAGLRSRLVDRGLELVRNYSWQATARQTLDIYREVLLERVASSS
jgi:glycosyltransferase involved in cell wall biosynthesis